MESQFMCTKCGGATPPERAVEIDGNVFCKACLSRFASSRDDSFARPVYKPRINRFFLFVTSSLPGINYMYMGLMKRGLTFLSLFFGIIFMMSTFINNGTSALAFAFTIPIIYAYSFFDGFAKRRLLVNGINVPDDASEVFDFFAKYKLFIFGIIALCIFSSFFDSLRRILPINALSGLIGIVLIVYGFCLLSKSGKSKEKDSVIDIRNLNE